MIKISKQNNSLIVEGIDNVFYPNNGDNSYPLNSLIVVTDNSDMATFRSVATNDVLFSGLIQNITINGEAVTKDNIIQKFDAVSNSSTGGGTVDAYTKEEADNKFASKDELTNVQTVANDADTKVDALTPRVEGVETALGNKQDTLVSGENIKTINSQSIIGSGDLTISGVSEEQAQEIAKIPTLETELAQKANVSDIPTVQTGINGTNKNYVYSNADSSKDNDKVVSDCIFINNAIDRLDFFVTYWGDGGPSKFTGVPLATHETAGIMSGNDKIKLDSIPENIQPTLVSGTNIKTINGESVLGEGNIEISDYYTKTEADEIFATTTQVNHQAADISALQTDMRGKQATLVSGENIKTINSESILGSGDIQINGVSEEQAQEIAKIPTIETELAQKANVSDVPTVQTGEEGTNKNYIYSTPFDINYSVYSEFNFRSNEQGLQMVGGYWGSNNNRTKLFQIPLVTTSKNGVMSSADKTKLDSIPENIQPTLVSGTNIKTINSQSILGEGNLEVTIPDATTATSGAMSAADKTKLDSISNEWTGTQSEYDALTTKDNNTIYYVTE